MSRVQTYFFFSDGTRYNIPGRSTNSSTLLIIIHPQQPLQSSREWTDGTHEDNVE